MLINVVYQNGKYGAVEDSELGDLINSKKIKKFFRSDGWCVIGVDPVRQNSRTDYHGPERRRKLK
jgi:hypothetical protein